MSKHIRIFISCISWYKFQIHVCKDCIWLHSYKRDGSNNGLEVWTELECSFKWESKPSEHV